MELNSPLKIAMELKSLPRATVTRSPLTAMEAMLLQRIMAVMITNMDTSIITSITISITTTVKKMMKKTKAMSLDTRSTTTSMDTNMDTSITRGENIMAKKIMTTIRTLDMGNNLLRLHSMEVPQHQHQRISPNIE
jgi:hypothetical protein